MVLTFNRKMMTTIPGEGGSPADLGDPADTFYEIAEIEQETIYNSTGNVPMSENSWTLNLTNFLSDCDIVPGSKPLYRTSEKESKGTGNLANGKPRYYPALYVKDTKEQIVEPEPDEPVDPPTDPAPTE